jgi:hypothetical protein
MPKRILGGEQMIGLNPLFTFPSLGGLSEPYDLESAA